MHRKYIDVTYFPQSIRRTFREDTIIAKIGEEYNDDVAFSSITINIKHYLNRYYLYRYGIRHYLNTNEKKLLVSLDSLARDVDEEKKYEEPLEQASLYACTAAGQGRQDRHCVERTPGTVARRGK